MLGLIAWLGGAFGGGFGGSGKKAPTAAGASSTHPVAGKSAGTSTSPTTPGTVKHKAGPTPVHRVSAVTEKWRLPTTVSRLVVLPTTGGLELLGGLLDGDTSSALVQHLALGSGKVTADGHLKTGVHDAAGAAYKAGLYVYGGGAASEVSSVQKVTRGATAAQVATLPAARSDLVAAVVGSKVVLLGGYDGAQSLADVLVSTDGIHFTVLTRLPVAVRYPAVLVRGGEIYLYGGDVDRKPSDVIQRINLKTAKAGVVGHLPMPISHEAALTFGTTVWLAGGVTPAGATSRLYRSDNGVVFTRAGSLPGPRSDAGVAMVHGVGYLVGGEAPGRLNTVVVLKPAG